MRKVARYLQVVIAVSFMMSIFVTQGFAEVKIAYVDLSSVFDSYEKTKAFDKKLEVTQKQKRAKLDKMVDEIKGLEDKLSLLSEKEREKKQGEIQKKAQNLEAFQREAETDLRKERDERLKEILQDIQEVVEVIAKKEGYDVILNDRVMLYGDKKMNISKKILAELNAKYKKKKK